VSSSAALVCSAALALLGVFRAEASPSVRSRSLLKLFPVTLSLKLCCAAGAGVSSSSAFVCSSALGVLAALGHGGSASPSVSPSPAKTTLPARCLHIMPLNQVDAPFDNRPSALCSALDDRC